VSKDRAVEAFQGQFPIGSASMCASTFEKMRENEDLVILGLPTQAGGKIRDRADRAVVEASLEADGSDGCVAPAMPTPKPRA